MPPELPPPPVPRSPPSDPMPPAVISLFLIPHPPPSPPLPPLPRPPPPPKPSPPPLYGAAAGGNAGEESIRVAAGAFCGFAVVVFILPLLYHWRRGRGSKKAACSLSFGLSRALVARACSFARLCLSSLPHRYNACQPPQPVAPNARIRGDSPPPHEHSGGGSRGGPFGGPGGYGGGGYGGGVAAPSPKGGAAGYDGGYGGGGPLPEARHTRVAAPLRDEFEQRGGYKSSSWGSTAR